MALVQCKECGNQISDEAEKCPQCGKKQSSWNGWKTLGVVVLILFVMSAINQCMDSNRKENAQKVEKAYLDSLTPDQREAELKKRADAKAMEDKKKQADNKRSAYAYLAFKSVKEAVNDRDSLKVEWVGVNEAGTVACVDYRAKNAYGGYVRGTATFINGKPSQAAGVWNANCTAKSFYDYTYVRGM